MQTQAESLSDVQTAIDLQPTHISYYELTLEPNTLFAKHPPTLPVDDDRFTMHKNGIALLEQHGYARYEISAFAHKSRRCQHNVNYWLFGDYLGIGAGAHSKISFANNADIVRRWKHKHPTRYLQGAQSVADDVIGGEHSISEADTAIEFMMNALRLNDGFAMPVFEQHTGMPLNQWQQAINTAMDKGLLVQQELNLKASEKGFDFLNDLLELFMPESLPNSELSVRYPVIPLKPE